MPPKGEEMKSESRGDFFDFVEDVIKNLRLLSRFLNDYKKCRTAQDLLKLFWRLGYTGVSLDDCTKMRKIARNSKEFELLLSNSQY